MYNLVGYNALQLGRATLLNGKSNYATSYRNEWSLISFFARGTFDFNDRVNLTATVRRDGSSKFGANNKWGTFPSVGAGWTISNEAFMAGNSTLSLLKLRAGWGMTGNSEGIGAYKSISLVGPTSNYYDGAVGDFVPGFGAIQNPNPNLKWEVLTTANIGVDFEFAGGKIQGSLDVYQKKTTGMLFPYSVPVGDSHQYVYNTIIANVGEMTNKGIELTLGTTAIRTADFQWNTRVVGSFYKNEITSLQSADFGVGVIRYNAFGGRGLSDVFASRLREGHPLGEFYIPTFAGFGTDGKVLMNAEDGGSPTNDYTKAHLSEKGQAQPRVTASWGEHIYIQAFRPVVPASWCVWQQDHEQPSFEPGDPRINSPDEHVEGNIQLPYKLRRKSAFQPLA